MEILHDGLEETCPEERLARLVGSTLEPGYSTNQPSS